MCLAFEKCVIDSITIIAAPQAEFALQSRRNDEYSFPEIRVCGWLIKIGQY